jgi:hypothetical protein
MALASEVRKLRQGRVHALLGVRARTPRGLAEMMRDVEDEANAGVGVHVELATEHAGPGPWPVCESHRPSLWAHAGAAWAGLESGLGSKAALAVQSPGERHRSPSAVGWGSDSGVNAAPVFDATAGSREAARRHYERIFVSGPRWAEQVFGEGFGVIEPGAPADLILVDYQPATDLEADTLPDHLAACVGRAAVSGAMVAGEIVMDHGVLVTVDELEVAARARECARRVRQRL